VSSVRFGQIATELICRNGVAVPVNLPFGGGCWAIPELLADVRFAPKADK
jgi:hypothetical protein